MRTTTILAAPVGTMVGAGWLLAGPPGVIVAAVLAALACLSLYRCAASRVLQLAGAHAITRDSEPDLYRLVDHLAEQAGTAPQLYWLPGDGANTLATRRRPAAARDRAHTGHARPSRS